MADHIKRVVTPQDLAEALSKCGSWDHPEAQELVKRWNEQEGSSIDFSPNELEAMREIFTHPDSSLEGWKTYLDIIQSLVWRQHQQLDLLETRVETLRQKLDNATTTGKAMTARVLKLQQEISDAIETAVRLGANRNFTGGSPKPLINVVSDGLHSLLAVRQALKDACNQRDAARDCGQEGVCRTPPGCQRHWAERNHELVAECTRYRDSTQSTKEPTPLISDEYLRKRVAKASKRVLVGRTYKNNKRGTLYKVTGLLVEETNSRPREFVVSYIDSEGVQHVRDIDEFCEKFTLMDTPNQKENTIIEDIARITHEANRAYCEALGDLSQVPWEQTPEWQKESARTGVLFHMNNPQASASASHDSWLEQKRKDGWKYGPVKDAAKKEHPCFVPYEQLPVEQRAKDYIFRGIVRALLSSKASSVKSPYVECRHHSAIPCAPSGLKCGSCNQEVNASRYVKSKELPEVWVLDLVVE